MSCLSCLNYLAFRRPALISDGGTPDDGALLDSKRAPES